MKYPARKKIQFALLVLGFFLIGITYFLYPQLKKETVVEEMKIEENIEDTELTNVTYEGLTADGSPYTINSQSATIDEKDSENIYMEFVTAKFQYKNGRIIIITSDKGIYNKSSGDIRFQQNILMIDSEENRLTSENLDMLTSKNFVAAYNNVKFLTSEGESITSDKMIIDTLKKTIKVSMFDEKNLVKLKVIE